MPRPTRQRAPSPSGAHFSARPPTTSRADVPPRRALAVRCFDDRQLARGSLAVIFLLVADEWLVSGLDKVLSPDFRVGLADNLRDAMKDNPNHWYVTWLQQTIIPHAPTVAIVVEVGELVVALGFALGALLWWRGPRLPLGWRRLLHVIVLVTLLASAFMTANYYVLMGKTVPWLNTAAPFDEGLSLDGLLTLIALALVILYLLAWPQPAPDDRPAPGP